MARGGGRPARPFALRIGAKMRKKVTEITDDAALPHISRTARDSLGREYVMTWTSDITGVLLYTVLGTLLVISWIYAPA
jgi:hypothetical protein